MQFRRHLNKYLLRGPRRVFGQGPWHAKIPAGWEDVTAMTAPDGFCPSNLPPTAPGYARASTLRLYLPRPGALPWWSRTEIDLKSTRRRFALLAAAALKAPLIQFTRLERPVRGRCWIDDEDIGRLGDGQRARRSPRHRHGSALPQPDAATPCGRNIAPPLRGGWARTGGAMPGQLVGLRKCGRPSGRCASGG